MNAEDERGKGQRAKGTAQSVWRKNRRDLTKDAVKLNSEP